MPKTSKIELKETIWGDDVPKASSSKNKHGTVGPFIVSIQRSQIELSSFQSQQDKSEKNLNKLINILIRKEDKKHHLDSFLTDHPTEDMDLEPSYYLDFNTEFPDFFTDSPLSFPSSPEYNLEDSTLEVPQQKNTLISTDFKVNSRRKAVPFSAEKILKIIKDNKITNIDELKKHLTPRDFGVLCRRFPGVTRYPRRIALSERSKYAPKKAKDYWTAETCKAEAAKHATRMDWLKASPVSYKKAHKYNWFKSCVQHMSAPQSSWTKQSCHTSALRFRKIADWRKYDENAYMAARYYGWATACTSHMVRPYKQTGTPMRPYGYWTKENIIETARQCKSEKEFRSYRGAQKALERNKEWKDECFNQIGKALEVQETEELPFIDATMKD